MLPSRPGYPVLKPAGERECMASARASTRAMQGETAPPEGLLRQQDAVQTALRSSLAWGPESLRRLFSYHLGWVDPEGRATSGGGGKALRPALCLFTCEAVGGDASSALPAAVALEIVHNFTLIHDDIQDEDRERRHRPTVWAIWGKPLALLAGNTMRTLADVTLEGLPKAGVETPRALSVMAVLTERCLEMIEGQYLDLNFERRVDVTTEEYLTMVSKKTGALVEAATHMGAFLGGGRNPQVAALGQFGRLLGLAFQARDDVLGIWGDTAFTGKPIGADIRRRKQSLPVVYAFQKARAGQRRRLEERYNQPGMTEEAVSEVLSALDDLGARAYAQSVAEEQGAAALGVLRRAGLGVEETRAFEQLTDFTIHRDH